MRAIADLLASFVAAYNAKDARALGDLFTPDAEIQDEDGDVTRGRDAIVGRFSGIFKENGGDRLEVDTDSLRFLGTDIAIEEGTASLSTGAETPPRTNRYSVIYARQGGRWLHALIRDEPPEDDPHERLEELEWMLGEWVNESDDGIVRTSCKWSDDGNFLLREFDVKVEGRIAPPRHPAHRLGRAAEAVPDVGLRRPGRLRRGIAVARRRPLDHQGVGSPLGRTIGLDHERVHGSRQGPDPLGDAGAVGRRRGRARHRPVLSGPPRAPARQVKSHDRPSVEHPRRQHNLSGGDS